MTRDSHRVVAGVAGTLVLATLVAVALGGCASSGGIRAGNTDWPAYAAEVYAMSAPERDALETELGADYAAQGGADRALRLAIVLAAPGGSEEDLAAALGLLDSAEAAFGAGAATAASEGASGSRDFIGVLRPLLRSLQEQQLRLAAESFERASLEEQLEQLKSLEEALNASAPRR